MTIFSTDFYTRYVYKECGRTLKTDISVPVQLFKIPWSVDYPNVKNPNRKLSETPPVKKKKLQVLSKYWLPYLNVTKPVEALQEFIRMSAASAIVWTEESPVTLISIFCISVWTYC
jgi:hypothetical protein